MVATLALTLAVFVGLQLYATDQGPFRELAAPDVGAPLLPAPTETRVRELDRATFEEALADVAGARRLSANEIERAASAFFRLQQARGALVALPPGAAHARERRALVDEMGVAASEFRRLVGMDPLELTREAGAAARRP